MEVEVCETNEKLEAILLPSHKITITKGSDKYVYWYVKENEQVPDFNKMNDNTLIKTMHAKGIEMQVNGFESFKLSNTKDYHLERKGGNEFIIKRLR